MDLELSERPLIECVQKAMDMSAQFTIQPREKLCDFLLGNRGGEIDIPGGQAGKCL